MRCGRASSSVRPSPVRVTDEADDFAKYWSVASKLVPVASEGGLGSSTPGGNGGGAPSSILAERLPDAMAMRSVPMRFYLPEGVPVIQDLVPPLGPDGASTGAQPL